jgi:acetylornithine deacetylase
VKDDVKAWLLEAAAQDEWLRDTPPDITFFGFHANGVVIDPKEELFSVLESAHGKVLDEPLQYRSGLTALTDIRHYNLYYGIPATNYGPRGGNIHSADEWVDLPSLKACTKVYAAFILEWCGVRGTGVE